MTVSRALPVAAAVLACAALLWLVLPRTEPGRSEPWTAQGGCAPPKPGLEGRAASPGGPPLDLRAESARLLVDLTAGDAERRQDAFLRACACETITFHEELARQMAAWMQSPDRQDRYHGFVVLLRMGPRARATVEPLLRHAEGAVRVQALVLLNGWSATPGTPTQLPPMLPFLRDEDAGVRRYALAVVSAGVPYDADLAGFLVSQIHAAPSAAHLGPEVALARMGPRGIAHLLELLQDEERILNALDGLAAARAEDLAPVLDRLQPLMLREQEENVQVAALRVLHAFQGRATAALPTLRLALGAESFLVRQEVLRTLASMGNAAAPATPEVLVALEDGDARIAQQAARVLGALRSPAAHVLRALRAAVAGEAAEVAAQALGRQGAAGVAHLREAFDTGDADARWAVLDGIAEAGTAAAPLAGRVLALLEEEDGEWAERATWAAGHLGGAGAKGVPRILARVREATVAPGVAAAAMLSLGEHAQAPLRAALHDPMLAPTALDLLRRMGGATAFALDDLAPYLRSKDATVRTHAVEAVVKATYAGPSVYGVSEESGVDVLRRVRGLFEPLREDPDREVRQRVDETLSAIDALLRPSR